MSATKKVETLFLVTIIQSKELVVVDAVLPAKLVGLDNVSTSYGFLSNLSSVSRRVEKSFSGQTSYRMLNLRLCWESLGTAQSEL